MRAVRPPWAAQPTPPGREGLYTRTSNNPAALTDFMDFLINQVNVLNEIVVQLATEMDGLHGT